jgi:hypothetical protein
LIEDLWNMHNDAKANTLGEWVFAKDGLAGHKEAIQ